MLSGHNGGFRLLMFPPVSQSLSMALTLPGLKCVPNSCSFSAPLSYEANERITVGVSLLSVAPSPTSEKGPYVEPKY